MDNFKKFLNGESKVEGISQDEIEQTLKVLGAMKRSAESAGIGEMNIEDLRFVVNNLQGVTKTLKKMVVELIIQETKAEGSRDKISELIGFLVDVAGMSGGISFSDFSETMEMSKQFKD